MITEDQVHEAKRAYRKLKGEYDRQQRRLLPHMSQDELYEVATGCDVEAYGASHCWRCEAWVLWVERDEKAWRESCAHPDDELRIKGDKVVCKMCLGVVPRKLV